MTEMGRDEARVGAGHGQYQPSVLRQLVATLPFTLSINYQLS